MVVDLDSIDLSCDGETPVRIKICRLLHVFLLPLLDEIFQRSVNFTTLCVPENCDSCRVNGILCCKGLRGIEDMLMLK